MDFPIFPCDYKYIINDIESNTDDLIKYISKFISVMWNMPFKP